jgi:hypothetical protein
MVRPVKTHPAHSTGLESKKNSSDGEGFSLDRSFYRTGISTRLPRNFRIAGDPSENTLAPDPLGQPIELLENLFAERCKWRQRRFGGQ